MVNKYLIGILVLVLLSSSIYILLPENVRIDVGKTYSTFKVWENDSWVLAGREYSLMFDGTTKMRASSRTVESFVDGNVITIIRTANFKNNVTVIDTYTFDGDEKDIKLFPISHKINVLNGEGYILVYEVTKLDYSGETIKDILSPQTFGHKMRIEWEDGNYYSRIWGYANRDEGKLTVKYRPDSADFTKQVRLFDPPVEKRGPKWDKNCNENACVTTFYSGIRNVYEDNQWKRIEDIRSLKGKEGFEVIYLKEDSTHQIEVIDFNLSSIQLIFSYDKDNLGEFEYEIEDGKMKTKFKIIRFNKTTREEYEEEFEIEIEEGDNEYITLNENPFGKKFKLGEDTTIIQLSNISNLANPYSTDRIEGIELNNDATRAYVVSADDDTFSIFNISNKSEIIGLDFYYDYTGPGSINYPTSLFYNNGKIVLFSAVDKYFNTFDVTGDTISLLSSIYMPDSNFSTASVSGLIADNYFIRGDIYFFRTSTSYDGLWAYDMSDYSNPVWLGNISISTTNTDQMISSEDNNTLFLTESDYDRVSSINISDPENMVILDTYSDSGGSGTIDDNDAIEIKGDVLYVTSNQDSAITLLDVSDPTDITFISTYTENNLENSVEMEIVGDYLFGFDSTGFDVWDISEGLEFVISYEFGFNYEGEVFQESEGIFYIFHSPDYDYFAITMLSFPDETSPTYSNAAHNTTLAGATVLFSVLWDDGFALEPDGAYIFSTNNTGSWINETVVSFTSTPQSISTIKTLNTTVGLTIGYRWYANDSAGNNNNTPIYTLTIETFSLEITDPTTSSPKSVTGGDNITITFNFLLGESNFTSGVTMENVTIGGEEARIISGEGETFSLDYEGFTTDFGNWTQATFDTDDWLRKTTAPADSSNTGPNELYDGPYVIVETSGGDCNDPDTAVLYRSPSIDFDLYDVVNISFAYNMIGTTMGTLHIKENSTGSWVSKWSRSGDQGSSWLTYTQNLTGLSGSGNIAIWMDCGASFTSDAAVDSVNITAYTLTTQEFAYVTDVGWQVNVTVPTDSLSGLQDLVLNATYLGFTRSDTQTNAINYGGVPEDTCTCPGAGNNWEVDMEDNCNLTSACTLTTGNLSWIGASGYFNCSANLNLTNRDAPPSSTIFYWSAGCDVRRLIILLILSTTMFGKRKKWLAMD